MFELQRLALGGGRELALETRKARRVENEVQCEPSLKHVRDFDRLVQKHQWDVRRPPCGVYNCGGHVWASRRTGIMEDAEWDKIKDDDGYRELSNGTTPKTGDLVVYRDRQRRTYIHVAEVVELRPLSGSSSTVPWVLSKLGACGGEVLHSCYNFPRELVDEITFWTDRPMNGG